MFFLSKNSYKLPFDKGTFVISAEPLIEYPLTGKLPGIGRVTSVYDSIPFLVKEALKNFEDSISNTKVNPNLFWITFNNLDVEGKNTSFHYWIFREKRPITHKVNPIFYFVDGNKLKGKEFVSCLYRIWVKQFTSVLVP